MMVATAHSTCPTPLSALRCLSAVTGQTWSLHITAVSSWSLALCCTLQYLHFLALSSACSPFSLRGVSNTVGSASRHQACLSQTPNAIRSPQTPASQTTTRRPLCRLVTPVLGQAPCHPVTLATHPVTHLPLPTPCKRLHRILITPNVKHQSQWTVQNCNLLLRDIKVHLTFCSVSCMVHVSVVVDFDS